MMTMMNGVRHHKDLSGIKFGKLTVIKEIGRKFKKEILWECLCDCGNKKEMTTSRLKKTKSCGCLSKTYFRDHTGKSINDLKFIKLIGKNKHNCWLYKIECKCGIIFTSEGNDILSNKIKSCGCKFNANLKKKTEEEIKVNSLLSAYRASAKSRNIEFKLKAEDIKLLCFNKCFYCNEGYSNRRYLKPYKFHILYNGIDRVDNNVGYIIDNCRTSCYNCNQAKHQMIESSFYEWVENLYLNLKKKEIL